MKDLKQHILEKLKIFKNPNPDITLESLIDALKEYKERKHITTVYLDLREILEEYPEVLQYNGTYISTNIVGEKIRAIGYSNIIKDTGHLVFLYFVRHSGDSISSIRILNTDDLYDIFGEEALNKIYDYIISH